MPKNRPSVPALSLTPVFFNAIIILRNEKTEVNKMNAISNYLTQIFIQHSIIESEKQEIYKTGIKLIVADIINFSLILTIGIISKTFIYACIYLLLFWTVRRFSGGFHAKTYTVCRVVFVGTYVSIICIGSILNTRFLVSVICNIITIITMCLFAPVKHPNKDLTIREKQANKFFALLTTLFFAIVSIILIFIGRREGLIISLILFAITILMYVGMLTNAKGGRK